MMALRGLLLGALFCLSVSAMGKPIDAGGGEVRVPLSVYQHLLTLSQHELPPAPAGFAIGISSVSVSISDEERPSADIHAELSIKIFEDVWTLIPVLPLGTPLNAVTVDGQPIQLVNGPDGLSWSTNRAAVVTMRLRYGADPTRSGPGFVLPVVMPKAAATQLSVQLPGNDLDIAAIPSTGLRSVESDGGTRVTATIPTTSAVLFSWRTPEASPYIISRAQYQGDLVGDAIQWHVAFDVALNIDESVTLPLLPSTVTLTDLLVDGERSTVVEHDQKFATRLHGRGAHHVELRFNTPVVHAAGPPSVSLRIPRIPVSHFTLTLPGNKDVSVSPRANVMLSRDSEHTQAELFVPLADSVEFKWVEAVPDALRGAVRANASLFHTVYAEEGVLHGRADIVLEVTHGETNLLELSVPADVQVNRVAAADGGISDWVMSPLAASAEQKVQVFLDRPVRGEYRLELHYERLVAGEAADAQQGIAVPLIEVLSVHRQRGMVALLVGPELSLHPVFEDGVTRVGENQLPGFVREQFDLAVGHTYKYTATPSLRVIPVAPEPVQGKFDAQVDTLISIGDVALKGSATIEVVVKSGAVTDLALRLPSGISVLNISAPSLRSHDIHNDSVGQIATLAFTQDMQGVFRIEVIYEHIMVDGDTHTTVPTISVADADVEHGRIAVEALAAVEIKATTAEQLASLDVSELPRQLVLKTTNPILLAYKYVHAEPPFRLDLDVTRHKQIDVQAAMIEHAAYRTLFTRDGLAVTTAKLIVRNSRQQFMRLILPPDTEVWSVFVDGKPEKPARHRDTEPEGHFSVLIKMINASDGFPVELVYATRAHAMGFVGTISGSLPSPDMVVTHTRWDVYLPDGARYDKPDTSLKTIVDGASGSSRSAWSSLDAVSLIGTARATELPVDGTLRIGVPVQGVHIAFEKLYANQFDDDATFSIRYASTDASRYGVLLSVIGAMLIGFAIVTLRGGRRRSLTTTFAALLTGIALLIGAMVTLSANPAPVSALTLIVAIGWAGIAATRRVRAWRVQHSTAG